MGNKTGAIVAGCISVLIAACGAQPSPSELRTQATIAAAQGSGMVAQANEIERQQIEARKTAAAIEMTRNAPTVTPMPPTATIAPPTQTPTTQPTNTPRPTATATPMPIVATAAARTVEARQVNDNEDRLTSQRLQVGAVILLGIALLVALLYFLRDKSFFIPNDRND